MHLPVHHVYQFQCPKCFEHTTLPRQSPLGTSVDQQYQPTDIWPINFLCFRYGQVFSVQAAAIHQTTIVALAPNSGAASLWEIECECVHNNCGKHHAIYTKYLTDAPTSVVIDILLKAYPTIACTEEHSVEFRADRMEAHRLQF